MQSQNQFRGQKDGPVVEALELNTKNTIQLTALLQHFV